MNVGCAYAKPTAQVWKRFEIDEGATVRDVIPSARACWENSPRSTLPR